MKCHITFGYDIGMISRWYDMVWFGVWFLKGGLGHGLANHNGNIPGVRFSFTHLWSYFSDVVR